MKTNRDFRSRKHKKKVIFNPSRKYLNQAVMEYLLEGGKINKIGLDKDTDTNRPNDPSEADEFLMTS